MMVVELQEWWGSRGRAGLVGVQGWVGRCGGVGG